MWNVLYIGDNGPAMAIVIADLGNMVMLYDEDGVTCIVPKAALAYPV